MTWAWVILGCGLLLLLVLGLRALWDAVYSEAQRPEPSQEGDVTLRVFAVGRRRGLDAGDGPEAGV